MKDLRKEIEDIRRLLTAGAFRDEQHVRISLVTRICQALGWDIWNPAEFYTEYPVKKYPQKQITVDARGRVDVALILTEKKSEIAEVFIEIKSPGKLQTELASGEFQLQQYNFWDKSAISILTDGITWRFYLPQIGGSWDGTLFTEINIARDDIDLVCQVFNQVLKRDNFRKQAIESAEAMYEELNIIRLVDSVQKEAEDISRKTGLSKYQMAQRLLKQNMGFEVELADIQRLWDRKTPGISKPGSIKQPDTAPETNNNSHGKPSNDKRTPKRVLMEEIIKALESFGGKAPKKEVHLLMAKNMSDRLTPADKQIDNSGQVCWEHQTDWARLELSQRGVLKPDSPRGIWELSGDYKTRL